MSHILAIDQSTSATKAILYDRTFAVVDRVSVEHPSHYPKASWVEQDAEQLWRNTVHVIRSIFEKSPHAGSIECLSITNQRETFVIFDRRTGVPLHPAVVWQCRRGDAVCSDLVSRGHASLVASKTGLKIDSYFSAPKLSALLKDRPDLAAKLNDGSALFGTIDAYLIYRLTGGGVFVTDPTNACRTLLFDINRLQWDEELCGAFGVPMKCLPQVRDCTGEFGTCDPRSLGISTPTAKPVPIRGVMGDSQAALFAQRCFEVGQAKVTLGTGSSVLLNVGDRLPENRESNSSVRTVGWVHAGKPSYALEGIISYSAATIMWLRDGLQLIKDVQETESLARAVPDNGGVYLVPAFAGLSAPYWSPDARAAIVGMSGAATRNHVVRAALESIAYQIRDVLDSMRQESGVAPALVYADGGATNNRFLTQFMADVIGVKLAVAKAADCSPLGSAMAGAIGVGWYDSPAAIAELPRSEDVFSPLMSATEANALYAGWKHAVKQVLAGTPPGSV